MKKGFTLIELLATIIILAIIALIVTPMISKVIESTKKSAAEQSAINYVKQVNTSVLENKLSTNKIYDGTYSVSDLKDKYGVEVTGNQPTAGKVVVSGGKVSSYVVVVDDYTVTKKSGSDDLTIVPTNSGSVVKLTGTPISTIVDNLITAAGTNTYTYLGGTYLKGAQTNNYVWFNGFVWRIMGKDADGNIRMITEENVTAIPWGASNSAQQYGSSYAKKWVSSYFYDHISPINQSIIKDTQFCEDSTLVTSSTSARTTCSVATVGAKGGLLSLDEYNLAGGSSSYLVNGQYYWTLTPQSTLMRGTCATWQCEPR
jgi:prepilin-type N-terminal cleavage/methylation domain-containing protein